MKKCLFVVGLCLIFMSSSAWAQGGVDVFKEGGVETPDNSVAVVEVTEEAVSPEDFSAPEAVLEEEDVVEKQAADVQIMIPKLNVTAKHLQDVFVLIAKESGLDIVVKTETDEQLTLSVNDISVWHLLTALAKVYDLAYVLEEEKVCLITAQDFVREYGAQFAEGEAGRLIKIRYADFEEVVVKLQEIQSPWGHVFVDDLNQQVLLLDSDEKIALMAALIKELDTPPVVTRRVQLKYIQTWQVVQLVKDALSEKFGSLDVDAEKGVLEISDSVENMPKVNEIIRRADVKVALPMEGQVMRVILSEEHQDGIDWQAIVSDYQDLLVHGENGESVPEKNQLSIGIITLEDYPVLLEALEAAGQVAMVFESPFMSYLNLSAETEWDTRLGEEEDAEGFMLALGIDPAPLEEGDFTLTIRPRLKWLADNPPSLAFGPKDEKAPQTSVQVPFKKDEVIVVGGLLREKEIAKTSKIPLLGNLPFLGSIFRHQNKLIQRREYIVFLIPEFVEETEK